MNFDSRFFFAGIEFLNFYEQQYVELLKNRVQQLPKRHGERAAIIGWVCFGPKNEGWSTKSPTVLEHPLTRSFQGQGIDELEHPVFPFRRWL